MTTPIPAEGRVELRIRWNGDAVTAATVQSHRPQPGRLLRGQPPAQALAVIPRLFSLCGDAQAVAVEALLALRDRGAIDAGQRAVWAGRIRLEFLREHLWRLGLDWTRMAGSGPLADPLRALLAAQERFAADPEAARSWAADTLRALFGSRPGPGTAMQDPDGFGRWLSRDSAPLAALLRELAPRLQGRGVSRAPLFGATDLQAWVAQAPARLQADGDYHWRPDHEGRVFEMGPLARLRAHPVLALADGRADAWHRVLARVLELGQGLQSLVDEKPWPHALHGETALGQAVVALEMVRGVLLHWVQVEDGRIAEYRIVAPTEWNFHPQGPAAQGLIGIRAAGEAALREQVALQVMALDPCVQHQLEIADA
ncbi:nickel-dependent hydrogenase, large subunit [Thioalkalivibrio nitratireducens DSM 14787]|uniref:Nickel-dependent hydrogenase, large subunit n=1 Tax=Thioalkalivibrio nitratireducens (strain DSM 14787 / UNIQEM 213 / ALEN2) TaxID=1255043 RepID=L0DVS9_THIND|nr:nickel-dependent hydrogenase large subunit [Thioalkalivibrio nitratireducens]AGA33709.1 nickel-dependent hydrogenase, large subunit [Thioalkalivibrio nitratireducens DSM 14787]